MNRDELLTKLAMEIGEWPKYGEFNNHMPCHPKGWCWFDSYKDTYSKILSHADGDITRKDWLQRRTELINKPSWDDAPEWAQWLAQDKRGEWCFYPAKPKQSDDMWINDETKTGIWVDVHCRGKLPKGHDWRETLEQRPSSRGNAGGTLFRAAAIDTGLCSDGAPCGSPHNPDDDQYCIGCPHEPMTSEEEEMPASTHRSDGSKYHREIKPGVFVDVYDVLAAWSVTNPALQHLIKKALQPGGRGHKTLEQDMADIVASAKRAQEIES